MSRQIQKFQYQSSSQRQLSPSIQSASVFIQKTYQILNTGKYYQIIRWLSNGQAFIIIDIEQFQKIVLPKFFRHNKMNSFIRQLNMYDFHKSRKDQQKSIYFHTFFKKGRSDLLNKIQRKPKVVSTLKKSNENSSPKNKLSFQHENKNEIKKVIKQNPTRVLQKKENIESNLNNHNTFKYENYNSMIISRPSIDYLKATQSKPFILPSEISIVSMEIMIQPFIENIENDKIKDSKKTLAKESQIFSFKNNYSVVQIEQPKEQSNKKIKEDDQVSILINQDDQLNRSINGISFIGTQHFLQQFENLQ